MCRVIVVCFFAIFCRKGGAAAVVPYVVCLVALESLVPGNVVLSPSWLLDSVCPFSFHVLFVVLVQCAVQYASHRISAQ